jgi:hypothetical protein
MAIMLESNVQKVVKINKKTKAQMFKNLKVGDRIHLSIAVKAAGSHRGTYASYITIQNLQTEEVAVKSFNEIGTILDCFEFEEEGSR